MHLYNTDTRARRNCVVEPVEHMTPVLLFRVHYMVALATYLSVNIVYICVCFELQHVGHCQSYSPIGLDLVSMSADRAVCC